MSLVVVVGTHARKPCQKRASQPSPRTGATRLPSVDLDSYNVEFKDDEGFIGDRASKGAFRDIIENWRDALRKLGEDPLGDDESEDLTKKKLDDLLTHGDPKAVGIVQTAIDEFSQEFALVIRRFLKIKSGRTRNVLLLVADFAQAEQANW